MQNVKTPLTYTETIFVYLFGESYFSDSLLLRLSSPLDKLDLNYSGLPSFKVG